MALNTFSHLAGTFDGKEVRIFVNGKLISSKPAQGVIGTNDKALSIGGHGNSAGDKFTGVIDDVRVYSRALSEAEIGAIYKAGEKP